MKLLGPLLASLYLVFLFFSCGEKPDAVANRLLVFSKTAGFRHQSIEAGQEALAKLAAQKGLEVDVTEDATIFNTADLSRYRAVVFLNTTGDILDNIQQDAFERYIQAGGGYVGIHSATDTEYDWPWYGQLAGAYFLDHPSAPSNVQDGKFYVLEKGMWGTEMLPDTFSRTDEFYSFKNISPDITPIVAIDESSYAGGSNPDFHPMSWFQEFDGGRSFYTAMGHTEETFQEPLFLEHLWAGIHYAMGGESPRSLNYDNARPEENRFSKNVLAEGLDEPMELTLLDEDRILFIQRKGQVVLFRKSTGELKTIAEIPVSLNYVDAEGKESRAEDGLLGLNKDPNFAENNYVYLYYSPTDKSVNRLSRFTMEGDDLPLSSEVMMLEVPVQRLQCCHTGGSIAWDDKGNLYLSTGDNTNPHASNGFSPSDERPGRGPWDAQKSSANTNDLRGKIIRIHPEADGSYTVPEGNLFAEGTEGTRPEIYTMGHRNPFRISVDSHTGYVYWGDVGPDARAADPNRGPAGHDEVGQAREAGNFGWPHFVGDNKAYHKYDFATEQSAGPWDPAAPINTSPNNTGLEQLPPAQPAFIWYPYAASEEFPLLGSGGRNAMAGPVYYADDFKGAERPFPDYYDGKLFAYEWMRGMIYVVSMDEEGNRTSMERFMPSYTFSNPMDMVFSDDGDLYLLEYGTGWFSQNDDARLVRIEFNAGNRPPVVDMLASSAGGAAPLALALDASATTDPDGDRMSYRWDLSSENGYVESFSGSKMDVVLEEEGLYRVELLVNDGQGGEVSRALEVIVGNEKPVVEIELAGANPNFYQPGQPLSYRVNVADAEDGSLGDGISADRVAFSVDYLAEGFDKVVIEAGHRGADEDAMLSPGQALIAENDCQSCHKVAEESIGPTYLEISERYATDDNAMEYLAGKIISGGGGVWGENAMAAHPELSTKEAAQMVEYIMGLAEQQGEALPLAGEHRFELPEGDPGKGVFILRAAYADEGAKGLPSLSSERTLVLRNANVDPHAFDDYKDANKRSFGGRNFLMPDKSGAYAMLSNVSLQGINGVNFIATAPRPRINATGGKIELRLDSPDGPLIGTSPILEPTDAMPGRSATPPPTLNIPIELPAGIDVEKPHDLYAVFLAPDGSDGDKTIMVVMGAMIQLESAGSL